MSALWLLAIFAVMVWWIAEGLRDRRAYDEKRDYAFPFAPDLRIPCRIEDGAVRLASHSLAEFAGYTLLLAVRLETGIAGRIRDPHLLVTSEQAEEGSQYFERGACGLRFVDVSALAGRGMGSIRAVYCRCAAEAELLAFRRVDLSGPILIVAPHPDDAELAAFGLYSRHADRTTIVTVSAGESLHSLKRQYIAGLDPDLAQATRRKGITRVIDAVSAPAWGELPPGAVIQLGYFNETLTAMERNPDQVVSNGHDPALRPAFFRRHNPMSLPSDGAGKNCWETLVADLAEVLSRVQPLTVVMPHPQLDPHPDHGAATRAMETALRATSASPLNILYYTTHIRGTAEHPFGPPHCIAGPPPHFDADGPRMGYFSLTVPLTVQRNKVNALETMHDLRSKPRWEKRAKKWAQRLIAGRAWPDYGEHNYFRTAIKSNEIFFVRKPDSTGADAGPTEPSVNGNGGPKQNGI